MLNRSSPSRSPEAAVARRVCITPDAAGRVALPADALFLASYFAEGSLSADAAQWLPDIWRDAGLSLGIASKASLQSMALARALQRELDGMADDALLPLTLDIAINIVEQCAERMMRLRAAEWSPARVRVLPERNRYEIPRIVTGEDYHNHHRVQPFQWLVLRLLAGCPDTIEWREPAIGERWNALVTSARSRLQPETAPLSPSGLYVAQVKEAARMIAGCGHATAMPPRLIDSHAWRRNAGKRARLAALIEEAIAPLRDVCGVPEAAIARTAQFWAEAIPVTRVETRAANIDAYARWFDRNEVRGFLTETGMTYHDRNVYFMAECHRRGLPTVVVQHGGQYGYDGRISLFYTRDLGIPSVFASWGWQEMPSLYDRAVQRARIVPVPNAGLCELAIEGRKPRPRTREGKTLLIPISKSRTLDPRIGGNATDGNLRAMRDFVSEVLDRVAPRFSRIVITYRMGKFEDDPIGRWVRAHPELPVEVLHAKEAPARKLYGEADLVLWDTPATGILETLHFNVPTVALLQRERWFDAARTAEAAMIESGIGVYDTDAAVRSIETFLADPARWSAARAGAQPFLDRYAVARDDYAERWRQFLSETFGLPGKAPAA